MKNVLEVREEIYNQFHNSSALESYFSKPENADKFAAYYTSMYLIQDSGVVSRKWWKLVLAPLRAG